METDSTSNGVDGDMTLIAVFQTTQNQGTNNDVQNTPLLIGAISTANNNDYDLGDIKLK